jgi:hypothetical protein
MSFLVSESSSARATETASTINASSTTWLKHPKTPTSTETTTTSNRQRWTQQKRNALADSKADLERARSEVLTTCTSSDRKRRNARTRMLDRKVQVVVAAVVVVDAAGAVGRAEEDRAAEVPVEEDRAEAAAVSEIVVPLQVAGAGVVVAEEAADVAEVEAEGVEASGSVRTLCLFRLHASIVRKEELVRASLGGSTLLTCLIHMSCSTVVLSARERATQMGEIYAVIVWLISPTSLLGGRRLC